VSPVVEQYSPAVENPVVFAHRGYNPHLPLDAARRYGGTRAAVGVSGAKLKRTCSSPSEWLGFFCVGLAAGLALVGVALLILEVAS